MTEELYTEEQVKRKINNILDDVRSDLIRQLELYEKLSADDVEEIIEDTRKNIF